MASRKLLSFASPRDKKNVRNTYLSQKRNEFPPTYVRLSCMYCSYRPIWQSGKKKRKMSVCLEYYRSRLKSGSRWAKMWVFHSNWSSCMHGHSVAWPLSLFVVYECRFCPEIPLGWNVPHRLAIIFCVQEMLTPPGVCVCVLPILIECIKVVSLNDRVHFYYCFLLV